MDIGFKYIKLSELVYDIEKVLSDKYKNKTYWIVAETSDIKKYDQRRYCFIKLIENSDSKVVAKIDAVIWWQYYDLIEQFEVITGKTFSKNLELLLNVRISFSAKFGSLNLEIIDISFQYTIGKLEMERKEILRRLVKENPNIITLVDGEYHTYNKSQHLPLVIQNIALVSAPNSDGLNDFIHELETNKYGFKFNIDKYLTQIQGQNASRMIIEQLKAIKKFDHIYDVVVIARGGGSQIDFGAFDTYEVGQTIAALNIPVFTGIGHERNISIADLMSHTSVKTPTKAASYIIDVNANFEEKIESLGYSFYDILRDILDMQNEKLSYLADKFKIETRLFINKKSNELEKLKLSVKYLNPKNVLSRGYAVLFHNKKLLTDPSLVQKDDILKTVLKDTVITGKILQKEKRDDNQFNL